jgi:hypothetical protein
MLSNGKKMNKNYQNWVVIKPSLTNQTGTDLSYGVVTDLSYTKETITKENSIRSRKRAREPISSVHISRMKQTSDDIADETTIDYETNTLRRDAVSGRGARGGAGKVMLGLISWAVERRDRNFTTSGFKKQMRALAILRKAGYQPSEIKDRWLELEDDKFFKEKGFDFMTIVNSFDKKP